MRVTTDSVNEIHVISGNYLTHTVMWQYRTSVRKDEQNVRVLDFYRQFLCL